MTSENGGPPGYHRNLRASADPAATNLSGDVDLEKGTLPTSPAPAAVAPPSKAPLAARARRVATGEACGCSPHNCRTTYFVAVVTVLILVTVGFAVGVTVSRDKGAPPPQPPPPEVLPLPPPLPSSTPSLRPPIGGGGLGNSINVTTLPNFIPAHPAHGAGGGAGGSDIGVANSGLAV